jgi:hypothetical protein
LHFKGRRVALGASKTSSYFETLAVGANESTTCGFSVKNARKRQFLQKQACVIRVQTSDAIRLRVNDSDLKAKLRFKGINSPI